MNKILLFVGIIFLFAGRATAQQKELKISDDFAGLLSQLPAENAAAYQAVMNEISKSGADGLYQLASGLTPYGNKDVSKLQYAVMGYSSYVNAPGREAQRDEAEAVWEKVIQNSNDDEQIAFFMDMLGIMGSNRSVALLAGYLGNGNLALKSAQTLAFIATPEAGQALLTGLNDNTDPHATEAVIQALGDMKYRPAADAIAQKLSGNNGPKEVAIRALVKIGIPSSSPILASQTVENGKRYANKENTAFYSQYIDQLLTNGYRDEATSIARQFFDGAQKSDVLSRIASLHAITNAEGQDAVKILADAAYDNDPEYRNTALQLASPYINETNIGLFVNSKKIKKAGPGVMTSLVDFWGSHHAQTAIKHINGVIAKSKDQDLRHAAFLSLAELSGENAVSTLMTAFRKGDSADAVAITQALRILPTKEFVSPVMTQLAGSAGAKHAALISLLGDREVTDAFGSVVADLSSRDKTVQNAAVRALPGVSGSRHTAQLFEMLKTAASDDEIHAVQQGIIHALESDPDKENIVNTQLGQFSTDKQYLLFPLLSDIGNEKEVNRVYTAYQNGNTLTSSSAFKTLISWPNENALGVLFPIAVSAKTGADRSVALMRYIQLVPQTALPDEQKLLLLQKAMSVATTAKEKTSVLRSVSGIGTFSALAFASAYLTDASTEQAAASAVINIGINNSSLYGTAVRDWLTTAMQVLEGHDDVYTKKSVQKFLDDMPVKEGFVSMFNGKDLTGWKGLVENPIVRSKMSRSDLAKAQVAADEVMRRDWKVEDGDLVFLGDGYDNITTIRKYGNFDMLVDWKIFNDGQKNGDAGIYLRGTPQVQIWDTSRRDAGAQVGSGGLYNNQKFPSKPLQVADNPLGDWNHFDIKMIGDKVTVYLNGILVTDNVPLENYWDRNMPIFPVEQIELQAHGSKIGYRNIYIKELPDETPQQLSDQESRDGFQYIFDGKDLNGWTGNRDNYVAEDGMLVVRPRTGSGGNLYTENEYGDFELRFEFKLTPGANNGIGIRTPLQGDAAYAGMEIQVLDNPDPQYKDIHDYQAHGSVYGVIPAKKGFLNPVGDWNEEAIIAKGDNIKVILNGETIVDGNIRKAGGKGTVDGKSHPGLFNKTGHIGLLGHGSVVYFKNMRIKKL